jgi:tetratricopeptide (TPR) repeat protein
MAETAVHVGGGGSKHKLRRVLVGFGIVLLVVVVSLAAGGAARWFQQKSQYDRSAKPEAITKEATAAQNLALKGDYDKAQETISKALDNPSLSAQAKHDLYMQQGVTYENQRNYDAALESYRKAESFKETSIAAAAIANIAEIKGDKQLAITYYKKAIPLIPDDAMKDSTKKYFENKITELEGGVVKYD